MGKNDRVFVIDGNSLIYRAFFALPPLSNSEGEPTQGVYGFLLMLFRLLDDEEPEYLAVAFDKSEKTFRHDRYPEYKAQREKMPDDLRVQIPMLKRALAALRIPCFEKSGFEADDLLGTLARRSREDGLDVVLVTGDRDVLQLVEPGVEVIFTRKGITDFVRYDEDRFKEEYGVEPKRLTDIKGLMGDSSDNIPGIHGVGPKTAKKLIGTHGSLEGVLEHVDQISGPKTRQRIKEGAAVARLGKELTTIRRDVPMSIGWEELKREEPDAKKAYRLFKRWEFDRFLERLDLDVKTVDRREDVEFHRVTDASTLNRCFERLKAASQVVILTPTKVSDTDPRHAQLLGLALAGDGDDAWFVPLENRVEGNGVSWSVLAPKLSELWEQRDCSLVGHRVKRSLALLEEQGVNSAQIDIAFDTALAAYVLDPTRSDYRLSDLSRHYLDRVMPSRRDFIGKGSQRKAWSELDQQTVSDFFCRSALTVFDLVDPLRAEINAAGLEFVYREIELPLIPVLLKMEHQGIKVDEKRLESLAAEFTDRLSSLENEIHTLAGKMFNINSPKQLGEILFEKLGYPVIKRTKTGYSTAADVLTTLIEEHDAEIAARVLDYRQLQKLLSTYVEGLREQIEPESQRVYTRLRQMVTATGRLSSREPNLQNIPIREEMGRRIRKAFVAEPGFRLVAADYSQIELRVLAQMSGDEGLIKAFRDGADIHRRTAAEIFGVKEAEVDQTLRNRAKAVNFGIVYGISSFGLMQNTGVTRAEAEQYIDAYFERYPKVKEFQEQMVEQARQEGCVRTMLGRIRQLPEIDSRSWHRRQFAERTAFNTPVQGTAADIIKLAMVQLDRRLSEEHWTEVRPLLQVHDELILEVPERLIPDSSVLMKTVMENVLDGIQPLDVPLVVDVKTGQDWYHMQPYTVDRPGAERPSA